MGLDLKRHAVLSLLAVLVGMAALWWLQPTTGGGAMLVMIVSVLLFNAVGAVVSRGREGRPEP